VCAICGEESAGFEVCPSDFDMVRCENEHIFHEFCLSKNIRTALNLLKDKDEWEGYVPSAMCPVCNLLAFDKEEVLKYIFKSRNINYEIAQDEIRERFKTYEDFRKEIKSR
jgi:hypothetical protein